MNRPPTGRAVFILLPMELRYGPIVGARVMIMKVGVGVSVGVGDGVGVGRGGMLNSLSKTGWVCPSA